MKVQIIIPYFEEIPPWLDYFVLSCSKNPQFQWLLYGDFTVSFLNYKNIQVIPATKKDFCKLATSKLGFRVKLDNPYKLCDFKPAFGQIFSDYLTNCDFWGYCDMDLIFGAIDKFVLPEYLEQFDIITTKVNYISGHFTLFRNVPLTILLYKSIWNIKSILRDYKKHFAIDELSNLIGRSLDPQQSHNNLIYKIYQKFSNSIKYRSLKNLPFQFDLTKVIQHSEKRGEIKVLHIDCVRSDYFYLKQNLQEWDIEWNNGDLYDYTGSKSIMYFHFFMSKKKDLFQIIPINDGSSFVIFQNGIRN